MPKQIPTPKRVAVYCRVATVEQLTLPEERKQLCINQIGGIPEGIPVDFYIDVVPGTIRGRPALQRLLADSEAGIFDQVVAKSVSDLGRNLMDASANCRTMRSYGTAIRLEREGLVV